MTASMKIAAAALLLACATAHPTLYPHVPAEKKWDRHPDILSWHFHVLYMLTDEKVDEALALRNKTIAHFGEYLGEECTTLFDNGRLCMIHDHDFHTSAGPFPAGDWSIFVPPPDFHLVLSYLLQHRGEHSLLVHPNTGYAYEDHSIWAMWSGEPWPLDMAESVLGPPHTRSSEHNHTRGDVGNPVCVPKGGACGDSRSVFPTAMCCVDQACRCGSGDVLCRCR